MATVSVEVSNVNEEEEKEAPSFGQQWAYLTRVGSEFAPNDGLLKITAWIVTAISGGLMPAFAIIFQRILDNLASSPPDKIVERATENLVLFIILGVVMLIFTGLQFGLWGTYGAMISARVRRRYMAALLRQDISYHELTGSGKVNQEMGTNAHAIAEGVGIKLGFGLQQIFSFLIGFGIAFYYSWLMTLVLLACMPVLVLVGVLQGMAFGGKAGQNADPFVDSGAMSQEVLANARTVYAFPKLIEIKRQQYRDIVSMGYPLAKKKAMILGAGIGAMFFGIIGVCDAVGLWYGAILVADGHLTLGVMFGCFFAFFIGGSALGQFGSVMEDLSGAAMAAAHVFKVLDREPVIRPSDGAPVTEKTLPDGIQGRIELKGASFAYPSNPDRPVLKSVSVDIDAGKTLAIVGPSGSGKSTIINLLERYYDPAGGDVLVDDVAIHNYDINFLRSQMSLVSQTPLLFNESIYENIRAGWSDVGLEEVEAAARLANAHGFIVELDKGYETPVGEMGGRLSGGQRQRIAIARALVKKPKILLLDEATSALDSQSEQEVQAALDHVRETLNLTMVVIAHRLSTVRHADKIMVLVDGEADDLGAHEELMERDGLYAALVHAQQLVRDHDVEHSRASEVMDIVDNILPPSYDAMGEGMDETSAGEVHT